MREKVRERKREREEEGDRETTIVLQYVVVIPLVVINACLQNLKDMFSCYR